MVLARRWIRDFGPLAGLPAEEFAERLVADLEGSSAARWEHDRLVSTVPHSRMLAAGGERRGDSG